MNDTHALIAVVDDDEDVRISLEALLGSVGHDVVLFENADELLRSPALADAACIVSDIQMPGIDGIQLARRLKSHAGPPVILMTAYPAAQLERHALEAGARRFLQKPFSPEELIGELEQLLC